MPTITAKISIREERQDDFTAVSSLVKEAFAGAEHTDGDERNLVARLRQSNAFIPALSLVAECQGKIVGHILLTRLSATRGKCLSLAPLSVLPAYQSQGIGGRLIRAGHRIATNLGYDFSIVIGYPDYYARFGYQPAAAFGFRASFDVPPAFFMACPLGQKTTDDTPNVLTYPSLFFER